MSDRFIEKKTISWHRVQEWEVKQYRENVCGKLNGLHVPYDVIRCNDVNCMNDSHRHKLSKYCQDIIHLCVKVKNKKRHIPYWNEIVKPLKDDVMFWDSVWVSCGKARYGAVHQIMKHSKHKHHYTIRTIKKRDADHV